jgi:uncharacterized protein YbbC (DUF1343 family)
MRRDSLLIDSAVILPGAYQTQQYLPQLQGKRVALVLNHTSFIGNTHLLDSLLTLDIDVRVLFAPEHGFRGDASAGEQIKDGKDAKTGLPIYSLHGKHKKPQAAQLAECDIVLFDIQDVGARFYTYISTLSHVMEACAELKKPLIVLDRPNPNGHYVDGPVLQTACCQSFVGMHPVPIVYGMSIGEYGLMVNGEGWLNTTDTCQLQVVKCENYSHTSQYRLPIAPSPNLPDMNSIYLYPSTCLFEGTVVSEGRGTGSPFALVGHPAFTAGDTSYIPRTKPGAAQPKLEGQLCHGLFLAKATEAELFQRRQLDFSYIIQFYQNMKSQPFFLANGFFDKLSGQPNIRTQIEAGQDNETIRASYQADVEAFKVVRKRYLLYPDFE